MARMLHSLEQRVALARACRSDYGALESAIPAPELPDGTAGTVALAALRDLFLAWGLDAGRYGTSEWNPLGTLIQPGAAVVLKPNWVTHRNYSGATMDCLVTHPAVIAAVLEYVAMARPGRVVLGDAPIQSCDFESLLEFGRLRDTVSRFRARGLQLEVADFRRSVLRDGSRLENRRDVSEYVLLDLAGASLLEPISARACDFRVTAYDPGLMLRTHGKGRHQYLIARELLEATVVINLPKLKTHKKACITGALKNLVGINGNKEFLPHHRKGGASDGGDCYSGRSWLKRFAEAAFDSANRRRGGPRTALKRLAEFAVSCAGSVGHDLNIEGSWYGNDTVWRTCLDLNRILIYGRPDGTLSDTPQRCVISITDAIVAGEGEGPLAPAPAPLGILTGALNGPAAEWVHARLMGFDPERIALVRESFGNFRWPLAHFVPQAVRVATREGEISEADVRAVRPFRAPEGWRGYCEASCAAFAAGPDVAEPSIVTRESAS